MLALSACHVSTHAQAQDRTGRVVADSHKVGSTQVGASCPHTACDALRFARLKTKQKKKQSSAQILQRPRFIFVRLQSTPTHPQEVSQCDTVSFGNVLTHFRIYLERYFVFVNLRLFLIVNFDFVGLSELPMRKCLTVVLLLITLPGNRRGRSSWLDGRVLLQW